MNAMTQILLIALGVALLAVILVPLLLMSGMMAGMMSGGMMGGGLWLMTGVVLLVLVAGVALLATGLRYR